MLALPARRKQEVQHNTAAAAKELNHRHVKDRKEHSRTYRQDNYGFPLLTNANGNHSP